VKLWVAGKKAAHAVFGDTGGGVGLFPFIDLEVGLPVGLVFGCVFYDDVTLRSIRGATG
jgi:hypothetical protein